MPYKHTFELNMRKVLFKIESRIIQIAITNYDIAFQSLKTQIHSPKEIAEEFVDNLDSDDAADIISELPENKKQEVLSHIEDQEHASDIVDLLNYDEDTAGGLMAKELIQVNSNWSVMRCVKEMRKQAEDLDFAVAFARIECHYFINAIFVEEAHILKHVASIQHIPTVIVQGRYDVVCPPRSAWELHKALPQSRLVMVSDAGHSMGEVSIARELVTATNALR